MEGKTFWKHGCAFLLEARSKIFCNYKKAENNCHTCICLCTLIQIFSSASYLYITSKMNFNDKGFSFICVNQARVLNSWLQHNLPAHVTSLCWNRNSSNCAGLQNKSWEHLAWNLPLGPCLLLLLNQTLKFFFFFLSPEHCFSLRWLMNVIWLFWELFIHYTIHQDLVSYFMTLLGGWGGEVNKMFGLPHFALVSSVKWSLIVTCKFHGCILIFCEPLESCNYQY